MAELELGVELPLPLGAARDLLLDELRLAGLHGTVRPAEWDSGLAVEVDVRVEPVEGGSRAVVALRGAGRIFDDPRELAGFLVARGIAPLLDVSALAEWVTDRGARRPAGVPAREGYRDPVYHRPNFRVILEELALTSGDRLLEVGCGGGAFLAEALRSGCRAAAVDHSPDMVRLAREVNREAVEEGRLEIVEADAAALPFEDAACTCAAMTGVLGFLPDPAAALREIGRVVVPGGRIVVLGSDPAWRGTPAAPEPFASRLRFYGDEELAALGRETDLADVRVVRRDLGEPAREEGLPDEALALFEGSDAPFLLARA